jgi:hypothetical protein
MSRCGTQFAISIDELKELANGQVRAIVMHLLPNGRENCGYWEVGSIEGESGQSLKINLGGALRGMWTDFSAPPRTKERAGNILQLIAAVRFGHNIGEACKWARSWLAIDNLDPARLATEKAKARRMAAKSSADAAAKAEKNRRRALQLYLSAEALPGTPAETYLCSRGIDLRAAGLSSPGSLKFKADVYCAETQSKLPAMVAAVVNLEGRHVATHRTYLQPEGPHGEPAGRGKATLIEAKKALGKYQGGFIPLWKGTHDCPMGELPRGTRIYVSEGIEDGLSVALAAPEERVIAALSLSNLGALELPLDCPIHILGQRDEKMRAIEAFAAAVARLQEKGHDVFLIYPPAGVKDYNDLLQRDGAAAQ